jgi:hypothetical protein
MVDCWIVGLMGGIDKAGDKVGRQSESTLTPAPNQMQSAECRVRNGGTLTPALSHRMGEGGMGLRD